MSVVCVCVYSFIYLSFSSSEIPQYRLPYDVVSFEVDLMKDLGVKVYTHTMHSNPAGVFVRVM